MTRDSVPARHRERRSAPGRRGLGVLSVLSEILVTLGVLVVMFIAWQQWFNDLVVSSQTRNVASQLSQQLNTDAPSPAPTATTSPKGYVTPAVTGVPRDGDTFGVLYIPRFGANFKVPIAQGTSTTGELDFGYAGHYESTQLPGAIGNFAIAGHRTTYGAPFNKIATLQASDNIYVQTAQGWYTYTVRNLEIVLPTQVSVLQKVPVPAVAGGSPKDRLITLTSCDPMYSASHRIVAFGVLSAWRPLSAGLPSGLPAATLEAKG